jgi:hypothetical protein
MADYDIMSAATPIFGIVGTGIGLGVLAHTARGVTNMMFPENNYQRRQPQRRVVQRRYSEYRPPVARRRPLYPQFNNYRQRYW